MHEIKTLLTSLLFIISRIEMLLLQFWLRLLLMVNDCFFPRPCEDGLAFLFTCVVVILRWVLCFCIGHSCNRLVRGGVLTGNPGHRVRVSNAFPLRWTISCSKAASCSSQRAVKPSRSLKV